MYTLVAGRPFPFTHLQNALIEHLLCTRLCVGPVNTAVFLPQGAHILVREIHVGLASQVCDASPRSALHCV